MMDKISNNLEYTKCNLCGGEDSKVLFSSPDRALHTPGIFKLVECRHCGLKYLNPRPPLDQMQQHYPPNYDQYSSTTPQPYKLGGKARHWFAQASRRAYLKLYRGYNLAESGAGEKLPRLVEWLLAQPRRTDPLKLDWAGGGRLLDVGCSNGRLLQDMCELGWQVSGVEVNEGAARFAREQRGLEVYNGTLHEAKFPDNYFEAITCSHVLEHFHDPLGELEEMRRILKPGGQLIIALPNWDSLGRRLFGSYWMALEIPRHLYHFDKQSLRAMLAKAGFEIVRESYTWRTAVWLDSLLFRFGKTPEELGGSTAYRLYGILVRNLDRLQLPELLFNALKLSDVFEISAK